MSGLARSLIRWLRGVALPWGRRTGRPLEGRTAEVSAGECAMASPRYGPFNAVPRSHECIDGSSTPLVRPYLAAYEHEEKVRIQRLRRDILWCATYGVDLDTRDIHACVAAS
ncbi:hypothetical protein TPA0906_45080 [Streptomyces olivaceus]|nr:hypothetical protein TPA0906_45080 [Streptomyces olivaceus]